jgi:hypothetical protein
MNLLDLAIAFAMLGITEAVVKPLAKRWVQRRILRAAPAILRAIDARLPELLALPTGEALEAQVRSIAEQVTGESWATDDLGPLFELFDLREAVRRQG